MRAGYQTRLQERYVWNSVDVLLEAFVFAYIGLQMRFIIDDLREARESLVEIGIASLVVLLVVLFVRPLCVFLMFGRGVVSRRIDRAVQVHVDASPRRAARSPEELLRQPGRFRQWRERIDNRPLTWQESIVVSWTGMRGVVTLAAPPASRC